MCFDFMGDLFHELSLFIGDIIVMGDLNSSAVNRYLDYVKKNLQW